MDTPKLAYSVFETTVLLGVSRAWLYQRWALGEGPPRCKVGSRTLIPAQGLSEWLARRTEVPSQGGRS
jgi:predicted DNA-binding transcriptional regulator AlpA